ncbi:MAG TPA: glycosyltransferase family 4 protein [Candidatus Paceibacterota bacterium]|nr:glycosyltransferase family 4 protein [Candidatus Paceibacterota bacterium]
MTHKTLRICYVANIRLPTEKAHGVQIMKTCEALVGQGHDVELLVPDRKTAIVEDAFAYYGVSKRFSIRRLPVWDTVQYGRIGFLFESLSFARAVRRYLRETTFDVIYGRDELVLAQLDEPYIWESHTGAWNPATQKVARRARCIVVITQGLKNFYVAQGIPSEKIIVAHDGVDLEQFAHPESKKAARERLGLPLDARIAMYVGRLDGWKGTETLLEAASYMPNILLAMIGGDAAEVAGLSRRYPNARFLGNRPYRELADNMAAADVLVLPNTGKDEISVKFTSPLKLFAYMTSGIPIVASDLPSIREILDERAAYLVPPDDSLALAEGIERAIVGGNTRATEALKRVEEYSWKHRAERILAAGATM